MPLHSRMQNRSGNDNETRSSGTHSNFCKQRNHIEHAKDSIKTASVPAGEEEIQRVDYDSDVEIIPSCSEDEIILIIDESDNEAGPDQTEQPGDVEGSIEKQSIMAANDILISSNENFIASMETSTNQEILVIPEIDKTPEFNEKEIESFKINNIQEQECSDKLINASDDGGTNPSDIQTSKEWNDNITIINDRPRNVILQASRYYPNIDQKLWLNGNIRIDSEGNSQIFSKAEKNQIQIKLVEGFSLHDSQEYVKSFRSDKERRKIDIINENITKYGAEENINDKLTGSVMSSNEQNENERKALPRAIENNVSPQPKDKNDLPNYATRKETELIENLTPVSNSILNPNNNSKNDFLNTPTPTEILQASRYFRNIDRKYWSTLDITKNSEGRLESYTKSEKRRIRTKMSEGLSLHESQEFIKILREDKKKKIKDINDHTNQANRDGVNENNEKVQVKNSSIKLNIDDGLLSPSEKTEKTSISNVRCTSDSISELDDSNLLLSEPSEQEIILQASRYYPNLGRKTWHSLNVTRNSRGIFEFYTEKEIMFIQMKLKQGLSLESAQEIVKNGRSVGAKHEVKSMNCQRQNKINNKPTNNKCKSPKKIRNLQIAENTVPNETGEKNQLEKFSSSLLQKNLLSNASGKEFSVEGARDAILQASRYYEHLDCQIWMNLDLKRNAKGILEYYTDREEELIRSRLTQGLSLHSAQINIRNARNAEKDERTKLINCQEKADKLKKYDQTRPVSIPTTNKKVICPTMVTSADNTNNSFHSNSPSALEDPNDFENELSNLPKKDRILHKQRFTSNLSSEIWTDVDITRNIEGTLEFYTAEEQRSIRLRLKQGLSLQSAQGILKNGRTAEEKRRIALINLNRQLQMKRKYEPPVPVDINNKYVKIDNAGARSTLKDQNYSANNDGKVEIPSLLTRDMILQRKRYIPNLPCEIWSDLDVTRNHKGEFQFYTKKEVNSIHIRLAQGFSLESAQDSVKNARSKEEKNRIYLINLQREQEQKDRWKKMFSVNDSGISTGDQKRVSNTLTNIPASRLSQTIQKTFDITVNSSGRPEFYTKDEKKIIWRKLQEGLSLAVAQSFVKCRRSPEETRRIGEINKEWPPPKNFRWQKVVGTLPSHWTGNAGTNTGIRDFGGINVRRNSDGKYEYFTKDEKIFIQTQILEGSMSLHEAQDFVRNRRTPEEKIKIKSLMEKSCAVKKARLDGGVAKTVATKVHPINVIGVSNQDVIFNQYNTYIQPQHIVPTNMTINSESINSFKLFSVQAGAISTANTKQNDSSVSSIALPSSPMKTNPMEPVSPSKPNYTANPSKKELSRFRNFDCSDMDRKEMVQKVSSVNHEPNDLSLLPMPSKNSKLNKIELQNPSRFHENQESIRVIKTGHYDVAIVRGQHPLHNLTDENIEEIKRSLLLEIDNAESLNDNLGFHDCKTQNGRLLLTCNNENTKNWLSRIIATLQPFQNGYLKVIEQKPSFMCWTFVPKADVMPFTQLQLRLQKQNVGLSTKDWEILKTMPTPDGGQNLWISIDKNSKNRIIAQSNKLFLNFSQIELNLDNKDSKTDIEMTSDIATLPSYHTDNQWNRTSQDTYSSYLEPNATLIAKVKPISQGKHGLIDWGNGVKNAVGIHTTTEIVTNQSVAMKAKDMNTFITQTPEPPEISTILESNDGDSNFSIDLTDEDIDLLLSALEPPKISEILKEEKTENKMEGNHHSSSCPVAPSEPPRLSEFLEKYIQRESQSSKQYSSTAHTNDH